jgi:hypothetical protein
MEGSLVAYKVFTNGSVLQASEINDNLMRQSVMVFSNAAARTAAITSPLEGMLTWLEDLNRYENYDGSAWVVESSGLVLLNTTAFTSSTLIRLNSIFNSTYDNYRIVCQVSSASGTASIRAKFLTAVNTPTSTSKYNGSGFSAWSAGGLSNYTSINETTFFGGITNGTLGGAFTLDVISPFLSTRTAIFQDSIAYNNHERFNRASDFDETTSLNGIQFESGSSLTGIVRVYGLRN